MPVAKRFLSRCAPFLALAIGLRGAPPAPTANYKTETGEIAGAAYTWLRPSNWNQRLLLIAHAQRPDGDALTAELKANDPIFASFLQDGWIIATTSFRRNGLIIDDAISDLDALRAEIVRRNGPLDRVLVEGDEMGAVIALRIAERAPEEPPLYQGVVAADPIFELREGGGNGITLQPKIPVVFLTTRREFRAAERYALTNVPKTIRPFTPALLRVNRDGRGNINAAEKSFALQTLDRWIDDGRPEVEKTDPAKSYIDATQDALERPSQVAFSLDRHAFTAHVTGVLAPHGDLVVDAQANDFATIGVSSNAFFRAKIGQRTFRVLFDKDESAVKRGEWVAFVNADGYYILSRRQLSAAGLTQASAGDEVQIEAYPHNNDTGVISPGEKPADDSR